jgi:hypothetical protein
LSQWVHDNRDRACISARASNDTTTWFIDSPAAGDLVADLEALAHRLNPAGSASAARDADRDGPQGETTPR